MSALQELKVLLEEPDVHVRQAKVDRWWREWVNEAEVRTAIDEQLAVLAPNGGRDLLVDEATRARRALGERIADREHVLEEQLPRESGIYSYRHSIQVLRVEPRREVAVPFEHAESLLRRAANLFEEQMAARMNRDMFGCGERLPSGVTHSISPAWHVSGSPPARMTFNELMEAFDGFNQRRSASEGSSDGSGEGNEAGEVRPAAGPTTPGTR